ncbi:uncharacterized protein [Struthio camelus]|uniref:uncharacterized protein n=1 Tax=Struthio camelus TaxID=8801 RepID=UPI003603CEF3
MGCVRACVRHLLILLQELGASVSEMPAQTSTQAGFCLGESSAWLSCLRKGNSASVGGPCLCTAAAGAPRGLPSAAACPRQLRARGAVDPLLSRKGAGVYPRCRAGLLAFSLPTCNPTWPCWSSQGCGRPESSRSEDAQRETLANFNPVPARRALSWAPAASWLPWRSGASAGPGAALAPLSLPRAPLQPRVLTGRPTLHSPGPLATRNALPPAISLHTSSCLVQSWQHRPPSSFPSGGGSERAAPSSATVSGSSVAAPAATPRGALGLSARPEERKVAGSGVSHQHKVNQVTCNFGSNGTRGRGTGVPGRAGLQRDFSVRGGNLVPGEPPSSRGLARAGLRLHAPSWHRCRRRCCTPSAGRRRAAGSRRASKRVTGAALLLPRCTSPRQHSREGTGPGRRLHQTRTRIRGFQRRISCSGHAGWRDRGTAPRRRAAACRGDPGKGGARTKRTAAAGSSGSHGAGCSPRWRTWVVGGCCRPDPLCCCSWGRAAEGGRGCPGCSRCRRAG